MFEQDLKDIEKNRIDFYIACLNEFARLDYNDPYLEQIKKDIKLLTEKNLKQTL